MTEHLDPILAVIGVWRRGDQTFYVRRSETMANYPGVWSLLSIQFAPDELLDRNNLAAAERLFRRMARQRLDAAPIMVKRYLTSGESDQNPMNREVQLHLYEVDFPEIPALNQEYYTDGDWLNPAQYEDRCAEQMCGLCLRLWSDYAFLSGYTDRPFIPRSAVGAG